MWPPPKKNVLQAQQTNNQNSLWFPSKTFFLVLSKPGPCKPGTFLLPALSFPGTGVQSSGLVFASHPDRPCFFFLSPLGFALPASFASCFYAHWLILVWTVPHCCASVWECISFLGWSGLVSGQAWDVGSFAAVLQCLHLDKPLLQKQNTEKLYRLKITMCMCNWGKL